MTRRSSTAATAPLLRKFVSPVRSSRSLSVEAKPRPPAQAPASNLNYNSSKTREHRRAPFSILFFNSKPGRRSCNSPAPAWGSPSIPSGDFLIYRTVPEQARAAQVYHAAIGKLQVDGHDHPELIIHARLRDLEAKHNVAACVLVERVVDLVAGQRGAVDVLVEEPVQAMIAVRDPSPGSCVSPSSP